MTDWCSWWPDALAFGQWAYCCYEHDFGKVTDWGLAECVRQAPGLAPAMALMGWTMAAGIKAFGWVYRLSKRGRS